MIFLKQLIKSAKHTGAIAPSSYFLAKKMVSRSRIKNARTIIELGPGTGAITKEIIKKMPKGCNLWTFEINLEFVRHLKKKYPKANHVYANISSLEKLIEKNNIGKIDSIISGIPFVSLDRKDCEKIFSEISNVMDETTRLVLFTYSTAKFKSFFSWFEKVDVSYVPINLPLAYVLTLKKKRFN
jgi:phosphatidylethanolamine/phosphatidyl-N-methylethanolamine N-methyltransferase